jgi:hypothetical protein
MTKTIHWLPGMPNSQTKIINPECSRVQKKKSVCKTSTHFKSLVHLLQFLMCDPGISWRWSSRGCYTPAYRPCRVQFNARHTVWLEETHNILIHGTVRGYVTTLTVNERKRILMAGNRTPNTHVRTCYSLEEAQRKSHLNEVINCKITGINHQSLLAITQQLKQSMIKTRHKFFLPTKSFSKAHSDMNVYVLLTPNNYQGTCATDSFQIIFEDR